MDERSERRRKRLTAMSSAAPGIEAEAVSGAVYFIASSLVRSAVESVVEAEAEVLADAVAKAVAEALPNTVDVEVEVEYDAYQWPNIDLGDGRTEYPINIRPEEVAEDLEDRAYEHVLLGIAEELIKSEGENA